MLRNIFTAGSSVCSFNAWAEKLRDKAGTHNPQTLLCLDCEGLKSQGILCSGYPPRGTRSKSCCYLVIAPRLNYLKDPDMLQCKKVKLYLRSNANNSFQSHRYTNFQILSGDSEKRGFWFRLFLTYNFLFILCASASTPLHWYLPPLVYLSKV